MTFRHLKYLRNATLDALVFEHQDAVFQHSGCVPVLGLMSRGHGDSGAGLCLLHLLLTIRAHSAQKRRQMQTSSRVGVCLWKVRGMHRVAPSMREALVCGTMHHRSSAVASLLEDRTVCAVTQASSSSGREPALTIYPYRCVRQQRCLRHRPADSGGDGFGPRRGGGPYSGSHDGHGSIRSVTLYSNRVRNNAWHALSECSATLVRASCA